ncbi:2,5-diamino-6-(ribosylamino)-4(3H)-pyrimidinone 5'-phosphate reductase [Thermodesulfobacterium sp.]|jgi:5-amino-6-(5-phosphoribosylamino)uracil reductase|uniref:2,5-diamino-6-(ribosylamino)-4(3H)-pyrimidinone 5'-phosphate reductase n=1 Tax=Thermodesulfobacterium sp. TaxID=1965289 RepID=UPI00074AFE78|nr:2,5-diamino-6-(ribosylamino)-4(3H)-pyrimidinone 5'-phosphate reductase [Thermodesulfobacterium sp.]KUJ98016.1 MAG: Riboflavin-specific deaminase domain protein [Thermodesulfobacterium sp. 37_54]KUK19234.1 MAG: Riboflavin-specific deaminase domain protein [Thermodesulfobacterium commune]MBZ4682078.1 5-amino-6-(5-phosphoribosylamino)uracil reductase [Thermodesulfobacterium sp.]HBT04433.1 2,5-diamino-6-(ribosylamino)-4(3H)-pyrimidinone 5'-phosphate reductase [Thermodesulfobacterium commune]HCP
MYRPYVIIVSEVTIDGKLTLYRGASSKELMSLMTKEVYRYLHGIRAEVDGIMVGCETVRTDDPSLTVRYVEGKNPVRIIPCSTANVPYNANIFSKDAPTIIATTQRAPKEKIEKLKELGAEVIVAGEELVDFEVLLSELYQRGIKKLMVEGGSSINWEFVKNRYVDEIRIIHLPVIVGGENVPTFVGGEGFKSLSKVLKLKIQKFFQIDDFLISEWKVQK